MKKIINPCTCMVGTRKVDAFCKIEYVNGELTIAGLLALSVMETVLEQLDSA